MNNSLKINWFPGHMHKSVQKIAAIINQIDLVIEVRDARALSCSHNHELVKFFHNKPILPIALKADLATVSKHEPILVINALQQQAKAQVVAAIQAALAPKLVKLRNKGLVNPIIQVLVCGLPNLGKSTLINLLVGKKITTTAATAGWTKKITKHQFAPNMWVYDSPGIFFKNVTEAVDGYILSLIGAIKLEVIPLRRVIEFAYHHLKAHYCHLLDKIVAHATKTESFADFLLLVCQTYHFITKNQQYDEEKALNYLYQLIYRGEIGQLSWTNS